MKYSILFIVLLVLFTACSETEQIVAPSSSDNVSELSWISLPTPNNMTFQKRLSTTKLVTVNESTKLKIKQEYEGGIHGKIKVTTELKFDKYSVNEDTFITMMIDPENGTLTFKPHMVFNKEAILEVKIQGLDLEGKFREEFDFAFLSTDGTIEILEYKTIDFDEKKGKLHLKDGKVPHFSRYGFVRRTPDF